MDKFILCLANSYKHGGRCIAGVEVDLNCGVLSVKRTQYGIPIWIRPISHSIAGEVPMCEARGIDVLSVVKVCGVSYAGQGSHSEDYYYQRLELIQLLNPSDSFLKKFIDSWHTTIFGNRGRALTPEAFEDGDYSVMLIRTVGSEIYLDMRYTPKPRIKFAHNGNTYDLPITDPVFLDRLNRDASLYHSDYGVLYIVLSLGVLHGGWHSKLAASIITPSVNNIREKVSVRVSAPTYTRMNHSQPTQSNSISTADKLITQINPFSYTQKTLVEQTRKSNIIVPNTTKNTSYRSKENQPMKPSASSNSGGCYIATSIYGSYDCPEVWTLRRFRDETLLHSYVGRLFVKVYYIISPKLVKYFGRYLLFRYVFKPLLDRLVCKLNHKGYQSTSYVDK